jgi:signal transduction histidine kinase
MLAAAVLSVAHLPGTAIAAAIGSGMALFALGPQIGLPAAVPLMVLPIALGAAATRLPDLLLQRNFDVMGIGVMVGASLLFLGSVVVEPPSWGVLWAAPLTIAVALAAAGEALATSWRLRHVIPDEGHRLRRLLTASVPLAVETRTAGAEAERARLALEIHNGLLPELQNSVRALERGSAVSEADRLSHVAGRLREMMQQRQTVTLEVGGVAEALCSHVETLDTAGVPLSFTVRTGPERPPVTVELAGYRVGQAAIVNALTHSGADRVEVLIESDLELLRVMVRDDGVGLDSTAEKSARRLGRVGLAQMRAHALAVGAILDIRARPGGGTEIVFVWRG